MFLLECSLTKLRSNAVLTVPPQRQRHCSMMFNISRTQVKLTGKLMNDFIGFPSTFVLNFKHLWKKRSTDGRILILNLTMKSKKLIDNGFVVVDRSPEPPTKRECLNDIMQPITVCQFSFRTGLSTSDNSNKYREQMLGKLFKCF